MRNPGDHIHSCTNQGLKPPPLPRHHGPPQPLTLRRHAPHDTPRVNHPERGEPRALDMAQASSTPHPQSHAGCKRLGHPELRPSEFAHLGMTHGAQVATPPGVRRLDAPEERAPAHPSAGATTHVCWVAVSSTSKSTLTLPPSSGQPVKPSKATRTEKTPAAIHRATLVSKRTLVGREPGPPKPGGTLRHIRGRRARQGPPCASTGRRTSAK